MRHDLIHSIREKCAHQEVLYGRLKQAGRARGLKLLPCAIVESSQFRLRLVVEGQRGRAFQLDFFAPIVFDNPRLEAQTIRAWRSEEHTSELQSLMRISYAVFCLKKKKNKSYSKPKQIYITTHYHTNKHYMP